MSHDDNSEASSNSSTYLADHQSHKQHRNEIQMNRDGSKEKKPVEVIQSGVSTKSRQSMFSNKSHKSNVSEVTEASSKSIKSVVSEITQTSEEIVKKNELMLKFDTLIQREEDDLSEEDYNYCIDFLTKLYHVKDQVDEIKDKISQFQGTNKDKDYIIIDESLIEKTLMLDDLETKGIGVLRKERKKLVMYIQNCMKYLDKRTTMVDELQTDSPVTS